MDSWRRAYFLPDVFMCGLRACLYVCVDGERLLFLVSCLSKEAVPAANAQSQRLPHNTVGTSHFIQAEENMWSVLRPLILHMWETKLRQAVSLRWTVFLVKAR